MPSSSSSSRAATAPASASMDHPAAGGKVVKANAKTAKHRQSEEQHQQHYYGTRPSSTVNDRREALSENDSKYYEKRQIKLPFEEASSLSPAQLELLVRAQAKRLSMQQWEIDAFCAAIQKKNSIDKGLAIVYEYAGRLDRVKFIVDRQAEAFSEALAAAPTKQRGTSPPIEAEFSRLFSAMVDFNVSALCEISLLRRLQWSPRPVLCSTSTKSRKSEGSARLTLQASLRRQTLAILEAITGSTSGPMLDFLSPLHLAIFLAPSLTFEQASVYLALPELQSSALVAAIEQVFVAVRNILYLEDGIASLYRSFHPKGTLMTTTTDSTHSEAIYNSYPLLRMTYEGHSFPTERFQWFWDAAATYRSSSDVLYFNIYASRASSAAPATKSDEHADNFFRSSGGPDTNSLPLASSLDEASLTGNLFGDSTTLLLIPNGSTANDSLLDVGAAGAGMDTDADLRGLDTWATWAASGAGAAQIVDAESAEALLLQEQSLSLYSNDRTQVRYNASEAPKRKGPELVRQWSQEALLRVSQQQTVVQVSEQQRQAELLHEERERAREAASLKRRLRLLREEEEERAASAARRLAAEIERKQAELEIAELKRLRAVAEEERRAEQERRRLEDDDEARRMKALADRKHAEEQAVAEKRAAEAKAAAKAAAEAAAALKQEEAKVAARKKAEQEEAAKLMKEEKERKEKEAKEVAAQKKAERDETRRITQEAKEKEKAEKAASKKNPSASGKSTKPASAGKKRTPEIEVVNVTSDQPSSQKAEAPEFVQPAPSPEYAAQAHEKKPIVKTAPPAPVQAPVPAQMGALQFPGVVDREQDRDQEREDLSAPITPKEEPAEQNLPSKIFQATPSASLSAPKSTSSASASHAAASRASHHKRPQSTPSPRKAAPIMKTVVDDSYSPVAVPPSPARPCSSPIALRKRPGGTPKERARQSRSMEMLEIYGSLQHPYTRAEARSESQVLQIALRQIVLESTGQNLLQLAARKISVWWKLMAPRKIFWRRWRVRNTVLSILDGVVTNAVLKSNKNRRLRSKLLRNGAAITLQRWYRLVWRRPKSAQRTATANSKGYRARITESPMASYGNSELNTAMNTATNTVSNFNSLSTNMSSSSPFQDSHSSLWGGSPSSDTLAHMGATSPSSPKTGRVSKSFTFGTSPKVQSRKHSSFIEGLIGTRGTSPKKRLPGGKSRASINLGSKKMAAILIQCVVRRHLARLRVRRLVESKRTEKRKINTRLSLKDSRGSRNFAVTQIQRIARGMIARNYIVRLLQASRTLNKFYRKSVAFGNLRKNLRRIDRPLILTMRSIRGIPALIYNTNDFLTLKVSVYWSPLLHIMPPEDVKVFIASTLPQLAVTIPNLSMQRVYTKEEQEAMAAKETPTTAKGLFSHGSFEKSPSSSSPTEDYESSDNGSSSSDEEEDEPKSLLNFKKMRRQLAKTNFVKNFARSIRMRRIKKAPIPTSSTCMTAFDEAVIRIPACHGNSVIKFELFNELNKKIFSALMQMGAHGRLMFWKEEVAVTLIGSAARRSGIQTSKFKSGEVAPPTVLELLATAGLPLRSRCGWVKVKVQGQGPFKRALASKNSSMSSLLFATWVRVYVSLDGNMLSLFDAKGSSSPLHEVPVKMLTSIVAEKGQILNAETGATSVKADDNYDVTLRIRKSNEFLVFRFPDSGARVSWLEILRRIIDENESSHTSSSSDLGFGAQILGGHFIQTMKKAMGRPLSTIPPSSPPASPSGSVRPGHAQSFGASLPEVVPALEAVSEKVGMPHIPSAASNSSKQGSQSAKVTSTKQASAGAQPILPAGNLVGASSREESSRKGRAGGATAPLSRQASLPGVDNEAFLRLQKQFG